MQQCRYCCTKEGQVYWWAAAGEGRSPNEHIFLCCIGIVGKGLIISPSILTKPEVIPEWAAACHCFHSTFSLLAKCRLCKIHIVTIWTKSRWTCIYSLTLWQLVWDVSSASSRSSHIWCGVTSWQGAEHTASSRLLLHLQKQCQEVLTQLKGERPNRMWVRPWVSYPPNSQELLYRVSPPMRLRSACCARDTGYCWGGDAGGFVTPCSLAPCWWVAVGPPCHSHGSTWPSQAGLQPI